MDRSTRMFASKKKFFVTAELLSNHLKLVVFFLWLVLFRPLWFGNAVTADFYLDLFFASKKLVITDAKVSEILKSLYSMLRASNLHVTSQLLSFFGILVSLLDKLPKM